MADIRKNGFPCMALLFFCMLHLQPTPADAAPKSRVFSLSLEELMETEVISSSRKAENAFATPDAIYVITNHDIIHSGYTSIADLLRMVPGVQVAQIDASKFSVTVRGFSGRYANKLLVQIDGRTVYTPLHSGVYWEIQDLIFEDIDRIEVIRGPGATLWGANAVNGIINIITKSAKKTKGVFAEGAYGNKYQQGAFRWGGSLTEASAYRVYGKYLYRDNHLNIDKQEGHDEMKLPRGGFRLDWDLPRNSLLTFQGDYYSGEVGQEYQASNGVDVFDTDVEGLNTLLRYHHHLSAQSDVVFQVYYDKTERKDSKLGDDIEIYDVDIQHSFSAIPYNDITWGIGFRRVAEQTEKVGSTAFVPDDPDLSVYSGFIQDRITILKNRLFIIPGAKYEYNEYTDSEFQPSGKLLYTPDERHTAWLSVSRAVRTPSIFERSTEISVSMGPSTMTVLQGNPNYDSEVLYAYEMGYRIWPVEPLTVSTAIFFNDYDKLSKTAMVNGVSTFQNQRTAETYGTEVTVNWNITEDVRMTAWYAFLDGEIRDAVTGEKSDIADPRHCAHVRTYVNLPLNLSFSTALYYVDDHEGVRVVSDYYRMDAMVKWMPVDYLDVSIAGRNLLVYQDGEMTSEHQENYSTRPDSGLVERSVYGQLTYRWQ